MPYALIPDGYTLKKVTRAQERAVNAKRRHDDVLALLNNPTTIPVVGGAALAISAPILLKKIFEALSKQTEALPDIEELGVDYLIFTKDLAEAFFDISGQGGTTGLFKGEAADFWEKYVKK